MAQEYHQRHLAVLEAEAQVAQAMEPELVAQADRH
jgi:hypothetical protein